MDLLQIETGKMKKAYGSGLARLLGEMGFNNQGYHLQNDNAGMQGSFMDPIDFFLLDGGMSPRVQRVNGDQKKDESV